MYHIPYTECIYITHVVIPLRIKLLLKVCTVFPRIEAWASISFRGSTRPLNDASFYTGPASINARSSSRGFRRVLFYAVYSSKLESDIVALSLEHIMGASVAVRPGLVLNSVVIAGTCG